MKKNSLRAATLALVLAVSVASVAAAAPRDREQKGPVITRVVKKLAKIFGITTDDDLPTPPWPKP
jgi:ABC-type sugar transport system substrate-binding protein